MTSQRYWDGRIEVIPFRSVEKRNEETGKSYHVRELVRSCGRGTFDCVKRLLDHRGVHQVLYSFHVGTDGVRVSCIVPRLSDDHHADCKRVEAFVNAVFWGEPTEGL